MKYKGTMDTNTPPTSQGQQPVRRIAHKNYRLTADSLREIRRGLQKETDRVSDDLEWDWEGGVENAPKTLRPAHLINGLLTWFLGLPEATRTAILRDGLDLYIGRLDGDPAAPFRTLVTGRDAQMRGLGGIIHPKKPGDSAKPKREDSGTDTNS